MNVKGKRVGKSIVLSNLAKSLPGWVQGDLWWVGGPNLWMCMATSRRQFLPVKNSLSYWGWGVGGKQEGANELLLCDKRDGGVKGKAAHAAHLFAQRPYSNDSLIPCFSSESQHAWGNLEHENFWWDDGSQSWKYRYFILLFYSTVLNCGHSELSQGHVYKLESLIWFGEDAAKHNHHNF